MTMLQRVVEDEILTKWNTRPFPRFPTHKDVPRFIRTITVHDTDGSFLYKSDSSESQVAAITRFIKSLAMAFEPDNVRIQRSSSITCIH